MSVPPAGDDLDPEAPLREEAERRKLPVVTLESIARRVAIRTGIPVHRMTVSEKDRLLRLEDHLHKRIIGQDKAIQAVARAIRRSRAGIKLRPNQPVGSFLFLGPTGTGKTELAKALAEFLFDDENSMVRVDMSEYKGEEATNRLVGPPPGFVGYDAGGALTEAVKRRPYSVVLFDEVDKAEPKCLDILMQVLDDGRLTDGKSTTVDFSNTVVILTSNFAGSWIAKQFWERGEVDREDLKRRLVEPGPGQRPGEQGFRPEFINRFDDWQVFHPLTEGQVREIAGLQIDRLIRTLASQGIAIEVAEPVRDLIAKEGYDPEMGGRPVRRVIDRRIGDPLATALLGAEKAEGAKVVFAADGAEIRLTLSVSRSEVAASN
jgi:ATP-dependent Clp protease ATP-binding subunit ClpA